jgi:hypothetical protein
MTLMITKRLHLEFTEDTIKELDTLQAELRFNTRKELIETSIDILTWIVKKRQQGRSFYAVDPSTGNATELGFIGLDRVKNYVTTIASTA